MKRYWMSWWTLDDYKSEPPFKYWITGERFTCIDTASSICAVIDSENEIKAWREVEKYFIVLADRFCIEKDLDWAPGDRFKD